jgi:LacI family transcriptional regulator
MSTMHDIAKLSNVSVSTVSRVLNGKGRVSEKKKAEILKIVKDMHYVPDYHAKCMTKSGMISVGLVVSDISNPFFSELTRGVEFALGDSTLLILMDSFRNVEREKKLVLALRDNGASGVIIGNSYVQDDLVEEISKFLPTVVFDKEYDLENVGTIMLDNFYGAYMVTKHLIENGCSNIFHLGGTQDLYVSNQRKAGYKKAMNDFNLEPHVVITGYDDLSGYNMMKKLLSSKEKIDGVFCMNDLVAIGALKAAKESGILIPKDVKFAGFDDIEICKLLEPPLTSVHQPIEEMGKVAAKMLIEMVDKKANSKKYVFSPNLVIRESSWKYKSL